MENETTLTVPLDDKRLFIDGLVNNARHSDDVRRCRTLFLSFSVLWANVSLRCAPRICIAVKRETTKKSFRFGMCEEASLFCRGCCSAHMHAFSICALSKSQKTRAKGRSRARLGMYAYVGTRLSNRSCDAFIAHTYDREVRTITTPVCEGISVSCPFKYTDGIFSLPECTCMVS